ncbi:MAG: imidazole glycerol phosphate synthase subunit HisH [Spirochaetales bacterium]|nr:imidazole glycerol phosphate synthase subunit HisH [Spirochaetales bacterium]
MKIGIIDYDAGNLKSVETALNFLGADYFVSSDPHKLIKSDKLIFPGVGEASSSMGILQSGSLDHLIKEYFKKGNPILGICLGCQIVLDSSEERNTKCLGLIPGVSREFSHEMGLKVPHMGWNQVGQLSKHYIFNDIPDNSSFYFVHSYYPEPEHHDASIASTNYGISFSSAFSVDNLVAVQFHPEKSGPYGLKMLDNFIKGKGAN